MACLRENGRQFCTIAGRLARALERKPAPRSIRGGTGSREENALIALPGSARFLAPQAAQLSGCLIRAFVDMRRQCALLQCVAQLGAKKTAGRVTGDAGIEAIDETARRSKAPPSLARRKPLVV